MADDKPRAARGDNEQQSAKQAAPAQAQGQSDQAQPDPAQAVPTPAPLGTDDKPLEGVLPFGVTQAGGEDRHGNLVEGDKYAHASEPGTPEGEIRTGRPMPSEAVDAQQARLAAGIPEPPKVGPEPTVTLYDTPGGYQAVPAGTTPEELQQAQVNNGPGFARSVQAPAELGADVRHVAGPAPGSVASE